jgi:hypothetical protein
MYDRNSGHGDEHGAPWLEDDEGLCTCSSCTRRRIKEEYGDYLADREREIDRRDARYDEMREEIKP